MTLNIQQIEKTISDAIEKTLNANDVLLLSKSISLLKTGGVIVVPSFSNLPLIDTVESGTLAYVKTDNLLYVADKKDLYADLHIWRSIQKDYISTVWGWGANGSGRLGDNTTVSKSSPVSVVGGFTDWCQVSAGGNHSAAVRTNGTIWAWGCGSSGQLGSDTITTKSSPVSVVGGFTDWCQVSGGLFHTAAVRSNGTIWSWGSGSSGQLGDNTLVTRSSPVSVVGGFTDWCQVSAGDAHTAAVRSNGTIWSWGIGSCGRLGDNTIVTKSSPVSVVGGFTDWCQVSAGGSHTSAVRTNGTIWAWGNNGFGQLGNNDFISKSSPVSVVGGFTDWCQVSAGVYHTSAVRTNGTIWTWGCGTCGLLGNNSTVNRSSPVSVVGGFTDWCQVSAGRCHTAAVRTNGTVWSWGSNEFGRLGDNTIVDKSSPVSVVGGFTDWSQVGAGGCHATAIRKRLML
jgi:alpha-tubulin suppressor-like RCC1 family protein